MTVKYTQSVRLTAPGPVPVLTVPNNIANMYAYKLTVSNSSASNIVVTVSQSGINDFDHRIVVGANETYNDGGLDISPLLVFDAGGEVEVDISDAGTIDVTFGFSY